MNFAFMCVIIYVLVIAYYGIDFGGNEMKKYEAPEIKFSAFTVAEDILLGSEEYIVVESII